MYVQRLRGKLCLTRKNCLYSVSQCCVYIDIYEQRDECVLNIKRVGSEPLKWVVN